MRDIGYIATEARMTIPTENNASSGILTIGTNFYEFVPVKHMEEENPETLLCYELEVGKEYSIIVTTAGGLYRYNLYDVIEVVGFYNKTPIIDFKRKGKNMSSIIGEKIHVNQLTETEKELEQKYNYPINAMKFIPNFIENCYEAFVELKDSLLNNEADIKTLKARMEGILEHNNLRYAQKIKSKRLNSLRLNIMKNGWSEAYKQLKVKNGARELQYKWQILEHEINKFHLDHILKTY